MEAVFSIMLKPRGAADYRPGGNTLLVTTPTRGADIAFDRQGGTVRGIVDAVFIPPGREENCISTVFVTEG
jgi:hypothetical protein